MLIELVQILTPPFCAQPDAWLGFKDSICTFDISFNNLSYD